MATGRGQFLLSLRQGFERIQPGRSGEISGGSRKKSPTREGNSSRRRRRRSKDERTKSPPPRVKCCPSQSMSHPSQSHPSQSMSHPSQYRSHLVRSHPSQSRSHPAQYRSHPVRSHPAQSRSHPAQSMSHPSQSGSHPAQSGAQSGSHPAQYRSHPARSHPSQSESHPSQSESHPSQAGSHASHNSFQRLPPEIILKIFSYLDAASLFSVGFVSRQFHDLANDNVIWYELYTCEMSRKKQKPRLCETPDCESPAVQDVPAAVWKKLLFSEMGWHRDTVWKKDLRHVNLNTGMPEHTKQVLRSLNVVWEITLTLKGGRRCVYKRSHAFFLDSSVSVCWSYGTWPKIHRVYSVELYGVLDSSTTVLSKPQWRSLVSKTLLSRTEKWRCIGTDSLVKLMQFDEGITVGIWRGTWVIAFIMATLHFHRLVERSVLGSLFCPYRAEEISPLHPEVPQGSGVHGYTVLVLLHNSVRRIMRCRFSPVLCTKDEFCSGYVQLRPLNAGMSEKHTAVSGKISFPWRAGELHGDVKNCCMMTVSVLDSSQRPVWCICSSSTLLLNRSRVLNETYDGEQFTLKYRDSDGKLNMTLVCMQDLQLYFLIGLHIWIRAEKVNTLLI